MTSSRHLLLIPVLAIALTGCSIKQVAMNAVADALSSGTGGSFSQDEDLQFVGEALPFALKMMESVNGSVPNHVPMKVTLASGFVQYGVVFVEWPAEQRKYDDFNAYEAGRARAQGFYLRANAYAFDGLNLIQPDFEDRILSDTDALLKEMSVDSVPLLYWLGASYLAAALTNLEDPEMFGIFPVATSVLKRAYELDPDWDNGALREIFISLEPVLPLPGGNERSREHYEAVLAMRGGKSAGPHVSYATAVPLKTQDKDEFVRLLELALAVEVDGEPESRLANEYAQSKARFLLDHLDDLFLE